jgi:hypothetical protein
MLGNGTLGKLQVNTINGLSGVRMPPLLLH